MEQEKAIDHTGSDNERFLDLILHWFPMIETTICSKDCKGDKKEIISNLDIPVHKSPAEFLKIVNNASRLPEANVVIVSVRS